jgi:AraC-like DNA-binding protein
MNSIYLVGSVMVLFFLALLSSKKPFTRGDKLLMIWIGGLGLHLLSYHLVINDWFSKPFGWLMLIFPPLIYFHGPMLYLYTLWSTGRVKKLHSVHYLHFLPVLASILNFGYIYIFMADLDMEYFRRGAAINEYTGITFYILNIFLPPTYVVFTLIEIFRHQKTIKQAFSYKDKIDLQWLKLLAFGSGMISLAVWISHFLRAIGSLENNYEVDKYTFLVVVLFVFVLGYNGFRQGMIYKFEDAGPDEIMPPKYEKSSLDEKSAKLLLEKIEKHVEYNKSFENSTLALNDLAEALGEPAYKISQVLNSILRKNFFNYINEFRVEEVKKKMIDPSFSHYSILGIALNCGFNSKASFNRIFKEMTGFTPSGYKKSIT